MPPLLVGNGQCHRQVLMRVVLSAVSFLAIGGAPLSAGAPLVQNGARRVGATRPTWTEHTQEAASLASTRPRFRGGVVLVAFRPGVSSPERHAIERAAGAYTARRLGPPVKPAGRGRVRSEEFLAPFELRVTGGSVLAVVGRLRRSEGVAYAEPDYLMHGTATPKRSGLRHAVGR